MEVQEEGQLPSQLATYCKIAIAGLARQLANQLQLFCFQYLPTCCSKYAVCKSLGEVLSWMERQESKKTWYNSYPRRTCTSYYGYLYIMISAQKKISQLANSSSISCCFTSAFTKQIGRYDFLPIFRTPFNLFSSAPESINYKYLGTYFCHKFSFVKQIHQAY